MPAMTSLILGVLLSQGAGASAVPCPGAVDARFENEVWAKVGERKCLTCHRKGGDAEKSRFVLVDPRKATGTVREEVLRGNRAVFAKIAGLKEKDQARMLLKVVGKLDHGGEKVLEEGSAEYRVLA